eukprot:m.51944 g.51944  ORF g.51944 m.51944 type:complete len:445 (+) comp7344_c0_seq1:106-1440(+)
MGCTRSRSRITKICSNPLFQQRKAWYLILALLATTTALQMLLCFLPLVFFFLSPFISPSALCSTCSCSCLKKGVENMNPVLIPAIPSLLIVWLPWRRCIGCTPWILRRCSTVPIARILTIAGCTAGSRGSVRVATVPTCGCGCIATVATRLVGASVRTGLGIGCPVPAVPTTLVIASSRSPGPRSRETIACIACASRSAIRLATVRLLLPAVRTGTVTAALVTSVRTAVPTTRCAVPATGTASRRVVAAASTGPVAAATAIAAIAVTRPAVATARSAAATGRTTRTAARVANKPMPAAATAVRWSIVPTASRRPTTIATTRRTVPSATASAVALLGSIAVRASPTVAATAATATAVAAVVATATAAIVVVTVVASHVLARRGASHLLTGHRRFDFHLLAINVHIAVLAQLGHVVGGFKRDKTKASRTVGDTVVRHERFLNLAIP